MNTKYKVQLTKDELNKFNFLQESYKVFESTKLKMMSVYQYMIKHSADSIDGLIKSFSDFWKMYKRHHKEIKSKSSFISIIYKLEAEGFIFIEKLGKVNIYHARKKFLNQDLKEELKEDLKHENDLKSIDTTKVDDDDQDTQILNNKNNYINIINNTSNDVSQNDYKNSLAYKKACEVNSKDIVAPVELMKIAMNILKTKKRKSEKLISMIRMALFNKLNIARINAESYVATVVADKIAKYEFNREMYARTITKNKNNYRLAHNKANSTFANFTQRKYDYDKLEAQLLGWDTFEDDYEI
jgi:hypothetical protein